MRLLSFIATAFISLPLAFLALSMALSNREIAVWHLWPVTRSFDWPLGVVAVVLLGIGFLAGAAFVALFAQNLRYRLWQQERRLARLEADLQAAEAKVLATPVTVPDTQMASARDVALPPSVF